MYALHHPLPRYRQPTGSSTSSTLLSTSGSGSGGSDAWMAPASTSTSRSIFSDGEEYTATQGQKYMDGGGDEETEVGTVVDKIGLREREDRPLIDLGDGYGEDVSYAQSEEEIKERVRTPAPGLGPTPTPGDKLRLLLRQMEAEVRNTTPAPPPPAPISNPIVRRRVSSTTSDDGGDQAEPTPVPTRSHWREGRRIGALPKERSYPPDRSTSPARSPIPPQEQEEQEEMEVLEDDGDSPPTPPLRITNPYLYNSRKVSDERRSQSPRMSSRAAVLHASTSRSPPIPAETKPTPPTALESYLARAPISPPSRKGKERAHPGNTSEQEQASHLPRRTPARTPRRRSVEIAPDDSALFAQGAQDLEHQEQVELDLDDSIDPPWMEEETASETDEEEEVPDSKSVGDSSRSRNTSGWRSALAHSRSRSRDIPELPELPEVESSFEDSGEEDGSPRRGPIAPAVRPRSRFSHSPSISTSTTRDRLRHSSREVSSDRSLSQSQSQSRSQETSIPSFTTAKTSSLSRSTRRPVPPVQPVFVDEEAQQPERDMATPPKVQSRASDPNAVLMPTPKPPGGWYSASKPPVSKVKFSPSPLRYTYHPTPPSDDSISLHRLKLSPRKPKSPSPEVEEEGNTSITQRLISMSKILSLSKPTLPEPSRTLSEARAALARAAESSALAQRKVESSQRAWLEALAKGGEGTVSVLKSGWSWGRWGWWLSMEILLLWGVFRVTLEYAQMTNYRLFDPAGTGSGPSLALAIPLPSAISAFVIPSLNRRGSVNFFDLVERFLGPGEDGGWVRVPA